MPTGTAKKAVTIITRIDPTQADRMPGLARPRDGKLVKKSPVSRGTPSIAMLANSAARVSTAHHQRQDPDHAEQRIPALVLADQGTQILRADHIVRSHQ